MKWHFFVDHTYIHVLQVTVLCPYFFFFFCAHGYGCCTVYIKPGDTVSFYHTQFHDDSWDSSLALEIDNCRARTILCAYFPRSAEYIRDLFD